jgi:predicted Zn-dependent protease
VTGALDVAEAALAAASGDEAEAYVQAERSGLARFASSQQHQPTLIEDVVVTLRVVRHGRVGVAVSNRTSHAGLEALAARAGEAADNAPADPDFPGLPEPSSLPSVPDPDPETLELGPAELAERATAAVRAAGDVPAYGYFTSGSTDVAIAATTGLRARQVTTDATVLVLASGEGLSGYASRTSARVGEVDVEACGTEAAEKARRTSGAVEVEPRAYRAVLEPYALAELLQYFAYDSLGANGLLEERSYLTDRLGETVFDEKVSIADDALDAEGLPRAFDFEGSPKQRVELVEDGVARGVVWDRRTAKRAGGDARGTGHAPPVVLQSYGPLPFALSMRGGDAESTEELVEAVGDGIFVTRLHYLGIVHPREGVVTGMTRDGTFRIRDGRVAEPLANLRFTLPVPRLLEDVPALGKRVTLVNGSDFYGERYAFGARVPAIATAYFNVTGVGSSPGI